VNHLPPYLEKYDEFKAKGVDLIAVISANDHWVLSGWLRFEGAADKVFDEIVCFGARKLDLLII
jgi:alkyl hydroperoxide reductase 1